MARNVEIKARVSDIGAVRARVEALGGSNPERLNQTDTFFNVASGRLKLRDFGDGTGELIAYERPDVAGPKLSDYVRVPTADPDTLGLALARALGVRAVVRKKRTVFLLGQTRVHLDEVDRLGTFIELEVVLREEQMVEEGDRIAAALLVELGVPANDLLAGAYVDLLQTL